MDKTCPKCNATHQKTGKFCSRACANSRTWNDADKQKKRESAYKYYATDKSIPQREAIVYQNTLRHADEIEEVEMIPYMSSYEQEDYLVDNDGDIWKECDM